MHRLCPILPLDVCFYYLIPVIVAFERGAKQHAIVCDLVDIVFQCVVACDVAEFLEAFEIRPDQDILEEILPRNWLEGSTERTCYLQLAGFEMLADLLEHFWGCTVSHVGVGVEEFGFEVLG